MNKNLLILASSSPRRQELLSSLGVTYQIVVPDIDESILADERPLDYVKRMADQKALEVVSKIDSLNHNQFVLASDTSVVVDGEILGKPLDREDAYRMLNLLSESTHEVLTSLCLYKLSNNADYEQCELMVVCTKIEFVALSNSEIEWYWQTQEPVGKAGAYGIQGVASKYIKSMQGSYSSVVGLPLDEVQKILKKYEVL